VAGLTVWNSLPDNLRDPDFTVDNFKHLLKTFLFSAYQATSAISALDVLHFTYLLSYLPYVAASDAD